MALLRADHAGLSRVLREIEVQQALLTVQPEVTRQVLVEAMRYLLVYQHSVHDPREDRLLRRIRARQPRLYHNMRRSLQERRTGRDRALTLAHALARATPDQLRGKAGMHIARLLRAYVTQAREHMRRAEVVVYPSAERVLIGSDWSALMSGPAMRDPAGDLSRLAARYPRLAQRLAQPERLVMDRGDGAPRATGRASLKEDVERVTERVAELLHESVDLARGGIADLRRARSQLRVATITLGLGLKGCRLAGRAVTLLAGH